MSTTQDPARTLSGSISAIRTARDSVRPRDLTEENAIVEGEGRERRIRMDELPEEYRRALEADDFVLYGKASVEQYDRGNPQKGQQPQRLSIEALEEALPSYLDQHDAGGPVSFVHQDVTTGHVIDSYTLDEPAQFSVGDRTLRFDAGETLRTHADHEAGEFWVVANLDNDTYFARKMRLLTLAGALDGFSVTIVAREWTETDKGQHVTALDWHSTTLGTNDIILNPDARFGVAEFKAAMAGSAQSVASRLGAAFEQRATPATSSISIGSESGATDDATRAEAPATGSAHGQQAATNDFTQHLNMGIMDRVFQSSGADPALGRTLDAVAQKAENNPDMTPEMRVDAAFDDPDVDTGDLEKDTVLGAMDSSDGSTGSDSGSDSGTGTDTSGSDTGDAGSTSGGDAGGDTGGSDGGGDAGGDAGDVDQHADGSDGGSSDGGSSSDSGSSDGGSSDSDDGSSGDGSASIEDTSDAIQELAENLDVSTEEVMDALHSITGNGDNSGALPDSDGDDGAPADGPMGDAAQHADGNVVTQKELNDALEGVAQEAAQKAVDQLTPHLENVVEEGMDDLGEKLETGGTGTPSGGPARTGRDLESELSDAAESSGAFASGDDE